MTRHTRSYIDLSHTIEDGLVTYRGLPAPIVCDYLSREDSHKFYEPGTEFQIGKIEMVALEQLIDLDGVIVSVPHSERLAITEADFGSVDVAGKAVLVRTDWSEFWNTERYFNDHPFLTEDAARYLADRGAKLVGIDSHNIDDSSGNRRPVHTTLLGSGVLIVEHMCNLSSIPDGDFRFTALPPKFKGVGTFPVRAFAAIGNN